MGVSLFLARRLSLSSGGKKYSPAVHVAVAAVALSIMIMMWAIAVVTGFKNEITTKVSGFNSDIILTADTSLKPTDNSENTILTLTPTLKEILNSYPFIQDYALQASAPAIFKTKDDFKGVYLKSLSGIGLERFLSSSIISGAMPDYSIGPSANEIVISQKVADRLGVKPGDQIDTYFITDAIRVRKLKIKGIYNSHFDNFDENFAYASLPLIQEIGGLSPTRGTSIAITVKDFENVKEYAQTIQEDLINAYSDDKIYQIFRILSARQSGAAYFQWLDLLDMNVIVILSLMTIVACVTLVSGMLILMVDKIRFIALMSALGASRSDISRIFKLLAARIALTGLIIGDLLALITLYIQQSTHLLPLDPESYYIDYVPVQISISSLLILNLMVLVIIWIILILPAKFAGRVAPARILAEE